MPEAIIEMTEDQKMKACNLLLDLYCSQYGIDRSCVTVTKKKEKEIDGKHGSM